MVRFLSFSFYIMDSMSVHLTDIKILIKKLIIRVSLVYLKVIINPVEESVDESSSTRAHCKQIEKR